MERPLPKLADVILKVRQLQNLSPAEEFVYLVYVEEIPKELAAEMLVHKLSAEQGNPINV